jgi:hypothetical protein
MSSEDVAFDADDSARPVARRVESVRTSLKPSASFRAPSVKVSGAWLHWFISLFTSF